MNSGQGSSLNLAVIVDQFDPEGGGAERSADQIVRHLTGQGHKVTVLAGYVPRPESLPEQVPDVVVEAATTGRPKFAMPVYRFAQWARRRVDEGRFDASLSLTAIVPATVVQPRGGTIRETLERNIALRKSPFARVCKRAVGLLSAKRHTLLWLERETFRSPVVKRIAAVSRYVAEQVERHYRIDPNRIVVIPNASELPIPSETERSEWRHRVRSGFHVRDDALVYLFAAYNPRLKGADTLLRATKNVLDRGHEVTLLMAGRFTYAQQHLAATLGIRSNVRFVGPTGRMAELYAASDVTVLPSYYDPSSKVVVESLMMGVPAISTSFNGASDLILSDNGTPPRGRVVSDPGDDQALADAMVELADPEERGRCSTATVGLADDLSMSRHVARLEELLIASAQMD